MAGPQPDARSWLATLRSYLLASAGLHLAWEMLQMPLYTVWRTGSWGEIAYDIAHCTAGDVMIAALAPVAALALLGTPAWPAAGSLRVFAGLLAIGIAYTIYSEWLNTTRRAGWAYTDLMPVLPILGTGLSPLLQWLIVPTLALRIATAAWPWQPPVR